MPIISVRVNENNRWKRKAKKPQQTNKQIQKETRGDGHRSYSESVIETWWFCSMSLKTKWFCCAFKLGFLQLICKVSLIFKSTLELDLSIILKQRESYESKHVVAECRCLKIWDLLSLLTCSSILVLKWRQVSSI